MTELIGLSEEQRLEAQEKARELVIKSIGEEPKQEDFKSTHISEYPMWFTFVILGLTIVFALIVFMPSLFRIFTLGYASFYAGISVEYQATIAGLSLVLTAEFAVILSGLLRETLAKTKGQRVLLWIATVIAIGITFLGNWTIVNPHNVMEWLEALSSPVMVLVTALSFERILLQTLLERRRALTNYSKALKQYQLDTKEPETHYRYKNYYASEIKRMLIAVNSKGRGQKERLEYLATLDTNDWKSLVIAEMNQENWFTQESNHNANFTQGSQSHYQDQNQNHYQEHQNNYHLNGHNTNGKNH